MSTNGPATLLYALDDPEGQLRMSFPVSDWFFFHNAPFLAPNTTGVMFRHELNGSAWWGYFRGCSDYDTRIIEPDCSKSGGEGREHDMHPHRFGPESFGPVRDALALSFARGHLHADAVLAQAKADYGPV